MQERILEGAEEFEFGSGRTGALLVHGFTGSPQSMRGLGEFLGANGLNVMGLRLPGHGTTWQDLNTRRSDEWTEAVRLGFDKLSAECGEVFVVGLSFGVSLAVELAAERPEGLAGVVSLAAYIRSDDPRRFLAPLVRRVVKALPGVGNDICDPNSRELCYEKLPTSGVYEMLRHVKRARAALPRVEAPILIIHSRNDHTAPPVNAQTIYDEVGSRDKELVWLERSYHVITLDYDKDEVFDRTLGFIRKRATALQQA